MSKRRTDRRDEIARRSLAVGRDREYRAAGPGVEIASEVRDRLDQRGASAGVEDGDRRATAGEDRPARGAVHRRAVALDAIEQRGANWLACRGVESLERAPHRPVDGNVELGEDDPAARPEDRRFDFRGAFAVKGSPTGTPSAARKVCTEPLAPRRRNAAPSGLNAADSMPPSAVRNGPNGKPVAEARHGMVRRGCRGSGGSRRWG